MEKLILRPKIIIKMRLLKPISNAKLRAAQVLFFDFLYLLNYLIPPSWICRGQN